MLFKKTLLASALLALGGFAIGASAATTATFQVKLTVNKACSISTTGDLNLGTVDANSGGDVTQNASNINVKCSKTTPYKIGLKPSSNSTDGTGTMAGVTSGNADTIAYALYQDPSNTTAWGNTAGTNTQDSTGNGNDQNYTVYGKVLASSLNVQPDSYADTVSVNVTY
jgi:spore coat protein U-like protein